MTARETQNVHDLLPILEDRSAFHLHIKVSSEKKLFSKHPESPSEDYRNGTVTGEILNEETVSPEVAFDLKDLPMKDYLQGVYGVILAMCLVKL